MLRNSVSLALLAMLISAQTGALAAQLPKVIDSCWSPEPPSKDKQCSVWVRDGDKYNELASGRKITPQRFDTDSASFFIDDGNGPPMFTYSGKITGNRIHGSLTLRLPSVPSWSQEVEWSASFFDPPAGNAASGRHVYVACENEISIVNTADHSVSTIPINSPGKPISAIVVSPGSVKAYVSNSGDPKNTATIFEIDGLSGTISRRISLQNTPTPSGFVSLAISGDGSTLYGVGLNKSQTGTVILALDLGSGAIKASVQLPNGYTGNEMVWHPRLVISGSKLVLDDGTLVDIAAPVAAPAVFSSDSYGLAAFPDGRRICAANSATVSPNRKVLTGAGVVVIGTRELLHNPGCTAISPDGTKTYVSGMPLRNQEGTAATNTNFGAVLSHLGQFVGITTDGKSLYTSGGRGEMLYVIDTATNLTTDAIRVCPNPQYLGMEPLTLQVTASVKLKGPEAIAYDDPHRVVATIGGKQITAQDAMRMIAHVAPATRQQYKSRLADLVEQLYFESQIVQEALQLHLDQKSPWKEQLSSAHNQIFPLQFGPGQTPPPNLQAAWQNARGHILWNAYFSQPGTPEGSQMLMNQKKEQYAIHAEDPDFFSAPSPNGTDLGEKRPGVQNQTVEQNSISPPGDAERDRRLSQLGQSARTGIAGAPTPPRPDPLTASSDSAPRSGLHSVQVPATPSQVYVFCVNGPELFGRASHIGKRYVSDMFTLPKPPANVMELALPFVKFLREKRLGGMQTTCRAAASLSEIRQALAELTEGTETINTGWKPEGAISVLPEVYGGVQSRAQGAGRGTGPGTVENLPTVLHGCAYDHCLEFTLEGGHYTNHTNLPNQSNEERILTIESFTRQSVVLSEQDTGSYPLTGTWTGQMSPDGNSLINGTFRITSWGGNPTPNSPAVPAKVAWGNALNSLPGN